MKRLIRNWWPAAVLCFGVAAVVWGQTSHWQTDGTTVSKADRTIGTGANKIKISGAAAGSSPTIASVGTDASVGLNIEAKTGNGIITLDAGDQVVLSRNGIPVVRIGSSPPDLRMQNNSLIHRDVNAGLTACTTQTQGQCPLTAEFNEIATTANTNDVCGTLTPALKGLEQLVINNGANTCQVFPASGDDLGSGVDTATTMGASTKRTFHAFDTTNWGTGISVSELEAVGFTKLGSDAPNIKMKKLTGTTGSSENAVTNIAHGLTLAKILGFNTLVTADNSNLIPDAFTDVSGFEFYTWIDQTTVIISLHPTNSEQLLSNAITVLLTYEE